LLDIQIFLEEDAEILAVLTSQKTNLNEILIQKQTGKKGSFKTAEKEAISQLQNQVISQLQNQVSCLERSVDKKFETILESIKNSQSAVNSWAQIAAQGNQKEQEIPAGKEQKQIQKQTKKQAEKQTKKQIKDQA